VNESADIVIPWFVTVCALLTVAPAVGIAVLPRTPWSARIGWAFSAIMFSLCCAVTALFFLALGGSPIGVVLCIASVAAGFVGPWTMFFWRRRVRDEPMPAIRQRSAAPLHESADEPCREPSASDAPETTMSVVVDVALAYFGAFFVVGALVLPLVDPFIGKRVLFTAGLESLVNGLESVMRAGHIETCGLLSGNCSDHDLRLAGFALAAVWLTVLRVRAYQRRASS
jgi:hypothetical protein